MNSREHKAEHDEIEDRLKIRPRDNTKVQTYQKIYQKIKDGDVSVEFGYKENARSHYNQALGLVNLLSEADRPYYEASIKARLAKDVEKNKDKLRELYSECIHLFTSIQCPNIAQHFFDKLNSRSIAKHLYDKLNSKMQPKTEQTRSVVSYASMATTLFCRANDNRDADFLNAQTYDEKRIHDTVELLEPACFGPRR